jgi:hypothetical protein
MRPILWKRYTNSFRLQAFKHMEFVRIRSQILHSARNFAPISSFGFQTDDSKTWEYYRLQNSLIAVSSLRLSTWCGWTVDRPSGSAFEQSSSSPSLDDTSFNIQYIYSGSLWRWRVDTLDRLIAIYIHCTYILTYLPVSFAASSTWYNFGLEDGGLGWIGRLPA